MEGFKADELSPYYCRAYYPVYMIRRLVFAVIIVTLTSRPYVQLILIILVAIVPVLIRFFYM